MNTRLNFSRYLALDELFGTDARRRLLLERRIKSAQQDQLPSVSSRTQGSSKHQSSTSLLVLDALAMSAPPSQMFGYSPVLIRSASSLLILLLLRLLVLRLIGVRIPAPVLARIALVLVVAVTLDLVVGVIRMITRGWLAKSTVDAALVRWSCSSTMGGFLAHALPDTDRATRDPGRVVGLEGLLLRLAELFVILDGGHPVGDRGREEVASTLSAALDERPRAELLQAGTWRGQGLTTTRCSSVAVLKTISLLEGLA